MQIEIQNVRVEDGRLTADLVDLAAGYTVPSACWPELVQQWPASLVQLFLIKEAVPTARSKLVEKRVAALAAGDDAKVAELDSYSVELEAEIRARVAVYFTAARAHYANDEDRLAAIDAEAATWEQANASSTALSSLAGTI